MLEHCGELNAATNSLIEGQYVFSISLKVGKYDISLFENVISLTNRAQWKWSHYSSRPLVISILPSWSSEPPYTESEFPAEQTFVEKRVTHLSSML